MKKVRFLKLLVAFVAVVLGVLAVTNAYGVNEFLNGTEGIFAMAGASAAVSIEGEPATTETADDKSSELLKETISQVITQVSPSATPLDTILRSVGRDIEIQSWESKYYAVELRGINSTVTAAYTGVDAATAELTVSNVHIWSVDDTGLVLDTDGVDGGDLVIHVVAKNTSTNKITCIALNGYADGSSPVAAGTQLPDVAQNAEIVRMGNAKSELDIQTDPYAIYPQPTKNYCQIHMAQVEESIYSKMHQKEVKWDISDFYTQAIFDLRRQMELTSLFGYAPATQPVYDPVGNENKYFSNGIIRSITKSETYTAGSLAVSDMVGWAKKAFTDNSGADERILFVGKDLMEEMSNIELSKQISSKDTEVKWGIRFNVIETNFGRFLVKHHRLFDSAGWAKKGLVLDMNNIERHVFKKFEDLELDLRTSGQKNVNANVISEAYCVAVRYPDTHMIIEPAS